MSLEVGLALENMLKYWDKIRAIDKTPFLLKEAQQIQQDMSQKNWQQDAQELKGLTQSLSVVNKKIEDFYYLENKIKEIKEMYALLKEVPDEAFFLELEKEITYIQGQLEERELLLLLNGKFDRESCYLSINAGAGGTESNDWASMLVRMFMRWAENKSLEVQIVDELAGDEVGIKSITLFIQGEYSYGYLKGEQGVHRLVRISPFDTNKKRHTSFASVSVYPEITQELDVLLNPGDLRIDTFRASGAGGQHVNKTESAIRIVHLPTGITVNCQQERSQHKNRELAMKVLKSRLYTYYQEQKDEELKYLKADKKDIAWGSQIRSYVFQPYKLVKDNRTHIEIGNIDKVMDGDLDPLLFGYLKWQYQNKSM